MDNQSAKRSLSIGSESLWEEKWFTIKLNKQAQCLICKMCIIPKKYNVERHYNTKHGTNYDKIEGSERVKLVHDLKLAVIDNKEEESELNKPALYASYKIAHLIARESRPFSIGPFVKQCLEIAAETVCPDNVNIFKSISLSPRTVARRIEKLSKDLERQLLLKAKNFIAFSLALDESTDVVDTVQLAIFIRGVDSNLSITEELLNIIHLKDTTIGEDILSSVEEAVESINLSWDKLASVATDGAAAMVGCNTSFLGRLKSKLMAQSRQEIHSIHCIIHQEALCAKSLKYEEVMKIVIKIVNFIRTTGLNHRQFREFLSSLESDYIDIPYFCETRWLSREIKDRSVPELSQPSWIADLAFLSDITNHLNTLNYSLQVVHFPNLSSVAMHIEDEQYEKYINSLQLLHDEFDRRFREMHVLEVDLLIFMTPFTVDINIVPADIQLELIDLKCDTSLTNRFHTTTDIVQFYSHVPLERFPRLHARAAKIMSMFGSTYSCKQLFSIMKLNKSRLRGHLTDLHLKAILRLSSARTITPDISQIISDFNCKSNIN